MEAAQIKAKAELQKSLAEADAAAAATAEAQKKELDQAPGDGGASADRKSEGWGASLRSWGAAVSAVGPSEALQWPTAAATAAAAEVEANDQREARAAELTRKGVADPAGSDVGAADAPPVTTLPPIELTVAQKKAREKAAKTLADTRSGLAYSALGGVHTYGGLYATAALGHDATATTGQDADGEGDSAGVSAALSAVRVGLEGWPDAFTCYFSVAQVDGPVLSSSSDDEQEEEERDGGDVVVVDLESVVEGDEEAEEEGDEEAEEEGDEEAEEDGGEEADEDDEVEEPITRAANCDPAQAKAEEGTRSVTSAPECEPEAEEVAERGLAKELTWAAMLPAEQAAAILLGWNAVMWDAGETPPCVEMLWADLSGEEQAAAITMGYTQDDWDAEEEEEEEEQEEEEEGEEEEDGEGASA